MPRKNINYEVVKLPNGKRKWIYGSTQKELEGKLQQTSQLIARNVDLSRNDTFGEYVLLWYKTYKEPYLRQNSKESLLNTLNNHIMPYLAGYKMRDITPLHVQMVFNDLRKKSKSLNSKVKAALKGIFDSAIDNNMIIKSPVAATLRTEGQKTEAREALTPEEAKELLSVLSRQPVEGAQQCWLFCLLALKTGLRRGELCGLMWADIDLERAEIKVAHNCIWPGNTGVEINTDLKTSAAARTLPLPADVVSALRWRKQQGKSLFVFCRRSGEPMTESAFRKMWEHAARVNVGTAFTPHVLRHTYCTRLFEAGLDLKEIQYLMGHSTPDMTMQIYAHYSAKSRYSETAEKIKKAL